MAESARERSAAEIIDEWRESGIRFVRFELPGHARDESLQADSDRARCRLRGGRPQHVRRRRRARLPLRRGRRNALQRGGGLRRPAPPAGSVDGSGRAVDAGHRAVHLRFGLGRRPAARRAAEERLRAGPRALPSARLRADARLRAGVLSSRRRDQGAALRGLPHLQHGAEHVRAVHPAARRVPPGPRPQHHHRQLRVRGLAVGDQLHPRHGHGRARRDLHVQERGQGARPPERLLRDVHVEAVLRLRRLGHAHPCEPPRRRGPEPVRGRRRPGRDLPALPALHRRETCATHAPPTRFSLRR